MKIGYKRCTMFSRENMLSTQFHIAKNFSMLPLYIIFKSGNFTPNRTYGLKFFLFSFQCEVKHTSINLIRDAGRH